MQRDRGAEVQRFQQLSRDGSCAGDFCAGADEVLQRGSPDLVQQSRCTTGAEVLSRCRGSAEVVLVQVVVIVQLCAGAEFCRGSTEVLQSAEQVHRCRGKRSCTGAD